MDWQSGWNIAIVEAQKGRAVLIINEAINDASRIKEKIIEKDFPKKDLIISTG